MKIERLLLLKQLLADKKCFDLRKSLYEINEEQNKNYNLLYSAINDQYYDESGNLTKGYRGAILEGSSRSGKTWASIYIIIWICLYKETNCTINIVKETYNEFKTTLYNDFKKILPLFNLPSPFEKSEEIKGFKIGQNKINFLGADKPSKFHGAQCEYLYFNEVLPIKQAVFNQAKMRCTKFWWADYNPSVTVHYIFDNVITRDDVVFLRTTIIDNPKVSQSEKNEILAYEPWKPGSYIVKDNLLLCYNKKTGKVEPISSTNQPPPHLENIRQGTADEYMWKVYGLGLRGAMQGVIFNHVDYIDEFPDLAYSYGLDFGFTTDPTALTKCAEDARNIYIELLCYEPIETPGAINDFLLAAGIEKNIPITADSSDKFTSNDNGTVEMVRDLRKCGWTIKKVSKTKSVMHWLLSMKTKKIHIVKNHLHKKAEIEQQMYKMREIGGISINQPLDKYNHMWDSARYRHMSYHTVEVDEKQTQSTREMGLNY